MLFVAPEARAQITRIDLELVESPALGGQSFGAVGEYERLRGRFYGEIDPADSRHRGIVNLEHAPLNANGRVEYSTTVEIYRPVDMRRWNRALYHTVPNRGGAGAANVVMKPTDASPPTTDITGIPQALLRSLRANGV